MTNKEFNKEEILEIACNRGIVAVNKITNKPCNCESINCRNCLFDKRYETCREAFLEWLNEEYKEPCEFKKDELVEVSVDEKDWCLRYFSHIDEKGTYGKYMVFDWGKKSEETKTASSWTYCRKYGTLGGLAKGEN